MSLDIFLHPVITHLLVFLLGVPVGILLNKLFIHSQDKNYNIKLFLVNTIHLVVLSLYIGVLAHAQFFGGQPPILIFSGLAAVSFGSLVGERELLSEILAIVFKSKKGK